MLTYRSGRSKSPAFARSPPPVPALKLRTEPKPRVSLSPSRRTPPKTERKSLSKLQTLFKQVCCPNCRYLFKVIKDDSLINQRTSKPSAGLTNVYTQTKSIITRDIAILTKEIEAILLPSNFDNVELPRFDQYSRITRKVSLSPVSGNATLYKFYRRLELKPSEGSPVHKHQQQRDVYVHLYEKEARLQAIAEWLKKEPPGTVSQVPSYVKALVNC